MTLKELLNAVYFDEHEPVLIIVNNSTYDNGRVYDSWLDVPEDVTTFTVDAIYNTPTMLRIDLC